MAKNKHRYNDQFFISDLRVLVYVVGYECYGESTILLIMNGDEVYYSIVIDSYHYKPYKGSPFVNKTVDILRNHRVEHLDLLCWTHPHDDHSKGISTILKKFCDEDTYVLFPSYIENNAADIVEMKQVSKDAVNKILEVNRKKEVKAFPVGVIEERFNNVDEFEIVNTFDDTDVKRVSIDAITPISNMLTQYVNSSKCSNPNELSITLVVDINDFGFYFGGDTTNEHIDAASKKFLGKCRFVKIPHHGSLTANHLTNYLDTERINAVCTSVFTWGRSHNPDAKVIKSYQAFFNEIYSTNKNLKKNGYGVIEYVYDFSCGYPTKQVHIDGNVGKMERVK